MASPRSTESAPIPTHGRVLIVEARFYDDLADALLDGAKTVLHESGCDFNVVTVPGALEIPAAIAMILDAGPAHYDGVIALGTVIRGETGHYDIVAGESSRALMDLAIARKLPLGNGILTVETEAQAWARARRSEMDKGGGAARACLAMIRLKRHAGAH